LDQLIISRISCYPALPDIRQGNLVSGRIPDIKKGRIIRPFGYPVRPYSWIRIANADSDPEGGKSASKKKKN
jgi:hypothetical protein